MAEVGVRVCPKHPEQVMTLLFNTYVCDICDPPTERIQFAGSGTSRETPAITVTIYPGAIGGGRIDSSSYLLCSTCGGRCTSMINGRIYCRRRHRTDVQLQAGDRLEYSAGGGPDMVYDGSQWVDVP